MANTGKSGPPDRDAPQGNVHRKRAERRPEIVKRRREQRRREFERQKRNWLAVRVVSGVLIVAILAAAGWWGLRQWQEYQVSQDVTTYFGLEDYAADHREGELRYEHLPPVGGPHNDIWQNCGYYAEPIYNWHGVHSLEHGAVWITYDPELSDDVVGNLRGLADQSYVLVSPYPGIEHPIVASVWGKQITFDSFDGDKINAFIREYRMNPDNTPEPGALCSLGVDFTIEAGETLQAVPALVNGSPEDVAQAEAAATAEAGGTPEGTPDGAATTGAPEGTASPAATPAGTPVATPD